MSVVNRRNAALGWTVWQVAKRVARKKAKAAVPAVDLVSKRPNKPAILSAVAALAGLFLLARRKSDDDVAD